MAAKPITLTTTAADDYEGPDPQPFTVVGDGILVDPQTAPTVDTTPADATAVATDLNALRTALIAAGVLTA
jgi:hypothetical protein